MNISYNWLRQYIDFNLTTEELSGLLTGCGLEVESIVPFESVKGGLRGLVVGEIIDASKHPNADRLTVTRVNLGNDLVSQIVCGAPNVSAGQKVVVALPGTMIYPLAGEPFEIKKSKIRGEASEGMICAEDEVGLGASHEGIMVLGADAVPGTPAVNYFNIESDYILSIGLTPNRPDAASHIGVARDIRAVLNTRALEKNGNEVSIKWPDVSSFIAPETAPIIKVRVESAAATRYSGVHITGVKVMASPEWLQNRLKSIGLKPINNVVDCTNYVLYEMGQPLHAFDASKIAGGEVIVKRLAPGTIFKTLDGVDRKLEGSELMICDTNGGMCIAGVFGGLSSGVSESTTEIFLESACFDAVSIRKTSKLHGLKTDASFRYERGSDPNITVTALKRAALLICEIAGGNISSSVIDVYAQPVRDWKVEFSTSGFTKLTGVSLSENALVRILEWLDIKVVSINNGTFQLEVPPYRVDVMREADVIEEVLRIYGYDNIPLPAKMNTSLPTSVNVKLENVRNETAEYLVANGYFEVMSNSLYRSSAFGEATTHLAKIKNPLSQDLDVMRGNMLFPLLDIAVYNRNRKRSDLRLFEFGKTYFKHENGYTETNHLSMLITGNRNPLHWQVKRGEYSLFYIKSTVDNIMVQSGVVKDVTRWEPVEDDTMDMAMILKSGKKEIVRIGVVKKGILKSFDLDGAIWFADVNLDAVEKIINQAPVKIVEPPKFPEVRRDLSMLLDKSVQYRQLETIAFETERRILRDVNLFDIFEGEKIGNDKKSYALSFLLRDDEKTLTDKEIDKVMDKLMESFEKKLGAVIRKS
ncbi:MAG: phenylalanine--tRNA ligase subunit beta [Bacteroidota bacterium]|nr:phenylalanine--tRNA ligase subunit beta [Bacteroidota bacterium]